MEHNTQEITARRSAMYLLIGLVLLLLACSSLAFGQEATIVGTVTDPSGAVIVGAKITATNTATGVVRTTATNESGQYAMPEVNIGHYDVKAESSGLKVAEQKNIVLQVDDRARVDFQMQVGAATESVTVEAAAVHVQTDTGEISNLITGQQLSNLAVNGTSLFQLAALAPGASNDITNYKDVPVGGDTNVSFNGQRTAHNVFMVDGGENYDRGCGGCVTTAPSTEAISEFRQLTSNYSADYGLSSAGTVTMAIKSGTSKFHASAWENNRNDALDARNFFFPAPNKKQELRMNIFGFNVGGPIIKNKTFFFYNMEWRKYIDGGSTNQKVPDTALYGGNFSSVPTPLRVPTVAQVAPSVLFAGCGGVAPAGVVQGGNFPGNVIPSCMINPNATALLSTGFLPAPTTNIANGIGNFVGGANSATNLKEEMVRIDHNFSSKFSVFGHFIAEQIVQGYNTAQWSGDNLPTVGDNFNNPARSYVIHATHIINSSLLNEMAFNYNGNRINIIPYAATGLKSLSLPSSYNSATSRFFTGPNPLSRIPNIDLGNPYGANFEISSWPWVNAADGYQVRDDVSWTKGAHQIKMGGSWSLYKKKQQLFGTTQGAFGFTGDSGATKNGFTGNSFGDFLLGTANSYNELAVQDVRTWPNVSWAAYVQDDWRVNNRLTLNLGLRWDGIPHAYEVKNLMGNFYPSLYDPAKAAILLPNGTISPASPGLGTSPSPFLAGVPLYLNGIGLEGKNGVPKGLVNNYWATFGPRLGFAYDLTGSGKTVIRGGFAVMYERIQGNDMYNAGPNIPFSLNASNSAVEIQNPNIQLSSGTAPPLPINAANITGLAINNYRPTASTQYSAGVQHSFGPKTVLSVSYVGNLNRHLNDYRETNLPSLAELATIDAPGSSLSWQSAASLPYKGFRSLSLAQDEANGHYNSMQIDLNSQASKDLQLRAYYTLSRSIDPSTGGSGQDLNGVTNPYVGWRYDLGPSIFDRTHNFSANFVYSIPLLRNSSSRLLKSTAGGWQVSGIVTIESGLPINVSGGSNDVVGNGNRPDLTGKISYMHKVLPGNEIIQYFDPTAFTGTAPGVWGNLGHNALRGPGRDNWNLSLFKTFAFTENSGLQLRLETFNTFNHTQFQGVSTGFGSGNFGQFTSAYDARIVQLGGKVYF
ncbi:MAG TPA: TonB-dependent receptor [Terriglobales bacterium]|nr:TonB-dependent receptor [Terriglobales bacterium]